MEGREGKKGKWKRRGREMEGSTYKGWEVKGNRDRKGTPVITVSPRSRGARIVTASCALQLEKRH